MKPYPVADAAELFERDTTAGAFGNSHSSHHLRTEFPDHIRKYLWGQHFWSPSYFVASCGGAPLDIIEQYITNQKRPD